MIKVKVRAAQGEYDASNDVAGYKAVEGGTASPVQQKQAAPVAPSTPAKKPWQK